MLVKVKGGIGPERLADLVYELRHLLVAIMSVFELEPQIKNWSQAFADELKHCQLAPIDKYMPVIPNSQLLEKLKSNLQEVKTRSRQPFILANTNAGIQKSEGVHVIIVPEPVIGLSSIIHTIPLQLLSYHKAFAKGTNVDIPKKLAKSVTVE